MKRSVAFAVGLAVASCVAGPSLISVPPNGHCRLMWAYDTNLFSTNLFFNIYETTNITLPVEQWPLFTNVIGTNNIIDIDIIPGQHYFVGTASNFWGETSITSDIGVAPALPVPINNSLKISKMP